MPRFKVNHSTTQVIADGTYVGKVVTAKEKTSEAGNAVIVMKLQLPDGRELPSVLTFVPAAEPVINAFCRSAELISPSGDGEAELTAADCLDRYVYIVITNNTEDPDSDPQPRITRFITREQALIRNPDLAKITLRPQAPRQLRAAY